VSHWHLAWQGHIKKKKPQKPARHGGIPIILAVKRLKHEDHEFETGLGYIAILYLKKHACIHTYIHEKEQILEATAFKFFQGILLSFASIPENNLILYLSS
jgi:hypothetical protein